MPDRSPNVLPGKVRLTFTGPPGEPYTVRCSSDTGRSLADWAPLATSTSLSDENSFEEPVLSSLPCRFYIISTP